MELPKIYRVRFVVPAVLVIAAGWLVPVPTGRVFGQRGPVQGQQRKPDKSKLPPPPPLREPDQAPPQSADTIRINSDLVTVVTTIARRPPNETLDLKRE